MTKDGKVIDVTLGKPGLSYFGVPFPLAEMAGVHSLPFIDHIIEMQLKAEMRKQR